MPESPVLYLRLSVAENSNVSPASTRTADLNDRMDRALRAVNRAGEGCIAFQRPAPADRLGRGLLPGDPEVLFLDEPATGLDTVATRDVHELIVGLLRHGITSLFAAFNIADGTVISQLHRRHRAIEFRKFLTAIDKAVPAALDVHLVCDNYATHNTAEIRTWLARHPRFRVHFTPTGSSWMNQVERWFGLLTDKLIRRGVHTSVQALENDIRDWIATWNGNPRPFTWTKTADEILSSLADYLAKLGPGHPVNTHGLTNGTSGAGH
jgi:transposase